MLKAIKGTRHPLAGGVGKVENAARRICATYGYQEIRTPIFKGPNYLFGGIGDVTDVVTNK
jgi:histidyl-tRNA synthetase